MPPEQPLESAASHPSRRSLLPLSCMAALTLALTACNKSSTSAELSPAASSPAAEVQKFEIPSSVIDINDQSTDKERLVIIADIVRLVTGSPKPEANNTMHTYHFEPDEARADQWQLRHLEVGFGTNDGICVTLVKQDGETSRKLVMVDIFKEGSIAFSDNLPKTLTTSGEKDSTVDATTQDFYGAALKQAKAMLERKANEQK